MFGIVLNKTIWARIVCKINEYIFRIGSSLIEEEGILNRSECLVSSEQSVVLQATCEQWKKECSGLDSDFSRGVSFFTFIAQMSDEWGPYRHQTGLEHRSVIFICTNRNCRSFVGSKKNGHQGLKRCGKITTATWLEF